MRFNELYQLLLTEAEQPPAPPTAGGEMGTAPAPSEGEEGAPDEGMEDDLLPEEPDVESAPEELELAKLAIRALFFNTSSKDVHMYSLKVKDHRVPFEELPDFFEDTKQWQPVISFVEYVMDKFEGFSSKWTEQPEIKGKNILDKIRILHKSTPKDQRLDNGKRLHWVRIIVNCLLHGRPTENINIGDVNEQNIKEIFDMLKMHYGMDSRGIMPGKDIRAPGVF